MASKTNVVQLKTDILGILGETAANLGVTLTETAPIYLEQLARLSAACVAARTAGQAAVADELELALKAQTADVASIVADEVSLEFTRTWQSIVAVVVKVAVIAIKAA